MLVSDLADDDTAEPQQYRLNPCFSGCWSRTVHGGWLKEREDVLILVLVDVGLGPFCFLMVLSLLKAS